MPIEFRIVPAREQCLPEINALIARSKAYWRWPQGYLENALPLHRLSGAYIRRNQCFEIRDAADALVAFFSLAESDARVVLDNLWVSPEMTGKGIGRRACDYIFRLARHRGWTELWVLPDPPAEGFYLKAGFSDTGERVPSRVPDGPVFSVFRIGLLSDPE
jgi:GNAT superfamily N-acetyltransferase